MEAGKAGFQMGKPSAREVRDLGCQMLTYVGPFLLSPSVVFHGCDLLEVNGAKNSRMHIPVCIMYVWHVLLRVVPRAVTTDS